MKWQWRVLRTVDTNCCFAINHRLKLNYQFSIQLMIVSHWVPSFNYYLIAQIENEKQKREKIYLIWSYPHVWEWDEKTRLKSLNQPLRSESNQAELAGCRLWTDSKKVIFALWSFTYTYDIIKNNNRCRFTEMFYYINNEILAFELTDKTTSCKTGSYNTERSLFYVIFTFFVSLCH